jgi:fructoselysine-6-P-deglycase FrlB-like protein
MAHVDAEIASQPGCWRRGAELAAGLAPALPQSGERVAAVGCGTSWYMAMAYAGLRERAGHGETDAYPASELPAGRRYDRVLAITRSGTTTEVLDLLGALPAGTRSTVLTADPGSPAAARAGHAVALPFADERSVVQTRFATTALVVLRTQLGEDLGGAISDAEVAVHAPLPVEPHALGQVTFLGRGWTVGLAYEAALKCREAATFWSEAYPAMEYRHGPIAIAAPGRAVWLLGEVPPRLRSDVEATGAMFVHSRLDPLTDLILAQRLAVALAAHRRVDPDAPRHLARSVVLT